jgi:hypothetical protein
VGWEENAGTVQQIARLKAEWSQIAYLEGLPEGVMSRRFREI